MIKLALNGYGSVAMTVFALGHCYDTSLVRDRDLDQAKFLLKKVARRSWRSNW